MDVTPAVMPGWPPEFTFDRERVLRLFTGDRFYSDVGAALREAILNAIDATTRRRSVEPDHETEIEVVFNSDRLTVDISDNGDGMSRGTMSALFSRVGASAADVYGAVRTVGEFGIGVLSYFLVGDAFDVQTWDETDSKIGLRFSTSMFAGGAAEELVASRSERGTSVTLHARDHSTFETIRKSFSHWCRDVKGLKARLEPEARNLSQGGVPRVAALTGLAKPEWVEAVHLGPISGPSAWESMSGESHVAVLYRGVFVQDFVARRLWGIDGSIDVDPKKFKPNLNRESFVGKDFEALIEGFLKNVHPAVLIAMAERVSASLKKDEFGKWSTRRWAGIWLSVPRSADYRDAARAWDRLFRAQPAFQLMVGEKWEEVSFERLLTLGDVIYVAPLEQRNDRGDVLAAALRLLRGLGRPVIRGLDQDRAWAKVAGTAFATTADLIAATFADEMPRLLRLETVAEEVLSEVKPVATLYSGRPAVEVARLGPDSAPAIRLSTRLVLNVDNEVGKAIVTEAIARNQGPWHLVSLVARLSHKDVSTVAAAIRDLDRHDVTLGPVKREALRRAIQ